ncbi:MAG: hypothetical protein JSR28_19335 [Proteobacteria bacterium]|nr:hypothetical protein [Pseudomonadota bacterium]MDE2412275.1 hypothetical protein [Sphingomonadales bacterium]
MAVLALRRDERIGLAVAVAAHVALVAWLVLSPSAPAPLPMPERMTVTLSDDVGLTSTAPQPAVQPAPDEAPVQGETAPQPQPQPIVAPQPQPAPPRPAPAPVARVAPAPHPAPPRPAPAKPAPAKAMPAPARQTGGSRIGSDFLKGVSGAQGATHTASPPAAAIGPAVRSALAGAISRQLKPKWSAPQGADADLLVTYLTWDLAADGSLSGSPRVIRQEGITDANRAQASRHAEQAVRAVRLAAPFQLPSEYYAAWRHVAEFRFDRRLSQ